MSLGTLRPPQLDGAIRFVTAAAALRPQSPAVHTTLAGLLLQRGLRDEAIAECREALRLNKNAWGAHGNLGIALEDKGRVDEALDEYREAVRLADWSPENHDNLGLGLAKKGRLDEAIAEYREAIALRKDFANAHINLGTALLSKGLRDEALRECREGVRLAKDSPEAHYQLAVTLCDRGQWADAIVEFQEGIRLKNDNPEAHCDLGLCLEHVGRLDEAIAECRKAIQLKEDLAPAHNILGIALKKKGRLDEAITEFREATQIKKDYADAHCNLGNLLRRRGQFREAVEELRLGHEFGSRNPGWPHPSARWLHDAERLAALDARLPKLLDGKEKPAAPGECLALAGLCQGYKRLYAASARWFGDAFALQPDLADDLSVGNRYNAACAAALAGCGQGDDAGMLNDKERTRLRKQALDWLRAELEGWRRLLAQGAAQNRPAVVRQLAHWQEDTDFSSVRGPDALAKLPVAEREPWRQLWADIADTLARAQGRLGTGTKPASK